MIPIRIIRQSYLSSISRRIPCSATSPSLLSKPFISRALRTIIMESSTSTTTSTTTSQETLFEKIASKKIPSTPVYENDKVYAFRDISPVAATHIILVPKVCGGLTQLQHATPAHKDILGELLLAVSVIAKQEKLEEGFRVVINDGPLGCQSVYHLHLHIVGGQQLTWPPGTGAKEGSMTG